MPEGTEPERRAAVLALLAEVVRLADDEDGHGVGRSSALTTNPLRSAEIIGALGPAALAPGRRVTWLAVNGRRVDARVEAPRSGQEWRLACSIDADGVHSAAVFERPAPFEGIAGGRAVIVDGPSSAGKSTVMAAVVARSTTPWVLFDEPSFGSVAMPFLIWPETAPTLQAGFVAGMAALAAAGNQVITSTGALTAAAFEPMLQVVPNTTVVRLDCPIDVRRSRQAARSDRWGGLTETATDGGAGGWTYDLRFDTSAMSAEDIADRVLGWWARLGS